MISADPKSCCWAAFVAAAALGISGCAYSAYESPYGTRPDAVARGQALAEQDCGMCHGLGLDGQSRFPGARPFRMLKYDYDAISYERATQTWHAGLAGMPPAELSLQDVAYIGSYIRSLKEHAAGR